jgi:hypothetical protein
MNFCFECPTTEKDFRIFMDVNGQTVARYWGKDIELSCPHCGGTHAFDFKQRYIAAAIASGHLKEAPTSTL